MKSKYKIITSKSIEDLENLVNKYYLDGWVLYERLVIFKSTQNSYPTFCQTMIRK